VLLRHSLAALHLPHRQHVESAKGTAKGTAVACCCCAGDTRKLLDDCAVLRPTVFVAVPRVYERVYSGVMDKVGTAFLITALRRVYQFDLI
jgi:long-subunit acyl-CoA synthetase (AMP-forming)